MEPSKFDELTKALVTATSRRQALKAIAATTLGSILGLSRLGTAFGAPKCHRNGTGCDTNSQCCSGYCDPTTSKCASAMCSSGTDLCVTVGVSTCGPTGTCLCAADVDGSPVCVALVTPICASTCTSDTDCGANQACVQASCCPTVNGSTGVCQPRC